jgi:hypothetical protein
MLQEIEIGGGIMVLTRGESLRNERNIQVGKITTKIFLFHPSRQLKKKGKIETHQRQIPINPS